jgi:hypothetical protein
MGQGTNPLSREFAAAQAVPVSGALTI